jgi:hypothetical protein
LIFIDLFVDFPVPSETGTAIAFTQADRLIWALEVPTRIQGM